MIIKTLSPETKLYHRILDMAEMYDTDVMYEVMKKVIEDIDRVEKERKMYGRQFQDAYIEFYHISEYCSEGERREAATAIVEDMEGVKE